MAIRTRSGVLVAQASTASAHWTRTSAAADGVAHVAEDGEDAVAFALALDDVAVLAFDARRDDGVVARQRLAHGIRLAFPEAGTAFDVGQQEGDHTGRQRVARRSTL